MTSSDKQPDEHSVSKPPDTHASRRTFLKTVSALGVAAIGHTALNQSVSAASEPVADVPPDKLNDWLAIATSSQLYREALDILTGWGFGFDATAASIAIASENGVFGGFVLQSNTSNSPRFGADLLFSIDQSQRTVLIVQWVLGWCQDAILQVASTILDSRAEFYPINPPSKPVEEGESPPPLVYVRPRQDKSWAFGRPVPLPPSAVEGLGTEKEWPIPKEGVVYWQYGHCTAAEWVSDKDVSLYRCRQVSETKTDRSEPDREIVLDYTDGGVIRKEAQA
jgi:hypothetical protein